MQAEEGKEMNVVWRILESILKESEKQKSSVDGQPVEKNYTTLPFDREYYVSSSTTAGPGCVNRKGKERTDNDYLMT